MVRCMHCLRKELFIEFNSGNLLSITKFLFFYEKKMYSKIILGNN